MSFLHAELAVFLINKYLIVYPSSALRYPFTGPLFRFQSPEPATLKDFRGTLSKESAAKLQEKVKKEREDMELKFLLRDKRRHRSSNPHTKKTGYSPGKFVSQKYTQFF
ncbi:hypothetical protein QMM42_16520 [Leptospira santarosai]|uniref:hypothetical protein n=1 Tax=Leptospira santarosai TaxID=28183 RepID=UPI0024AF48D3|nr:hypothetical protein [Leptospira santarosai]MDI7187784.1 hypothetical protein [Leptospira santarosai]MDI7201588.1 hypothetical protein [Leptospira santarosai]